MNEDYGQPVATDALRIQRSLPGPIERVWAYLTESDKRGEWMARGDMELRVGGKVHLFFHHASLSGEPGSPPAKYQDMADGVGMDGRVTVCEPPRRLGYTWGESEGSTSEVLFELLPQDGRVLLTVTHSRLRDRDEMVSVAGGWHAHLGILIDRLEGREPPNFWRAHDGLEAEYDRRLPAAARG